MRREALARAGGLAAIRGALIDDCALARRIKDSGRADGGRLWLGLTGRVRSLRPYEGLADIWRMVARSADAQLRHSLALLAGTLAGLALVHLAPPLVVLGWPWHGDAAAFALAAGAWALMTFTFIPMIRFYGLPAWRAVLLPLAALLYGGMTVDSALAHRRGRGGAWKGRLQGGSLGSDASL